MIKKILTFACIISSVFYSQKNDENVFVDKNGILRWQNTNEEVRLFGVNYTTPFAYAYRAHKRLGLSLKKAIDLDVNQFVRLGFDAFRIHMWDREISDKNGNVLQNEHLDLFDYLIYRLSQNGIKIIITPIAWWGTAWPEPEFETPGFSSFYSKVEMVTNPEARKAQKNYLKQIINHFNPYTKLKYKDDPSIIAVEIINEPHHPDDTTLVRNYINEMYETLRSAGFDKPIFYNISESWNDAQAQAVCSSKVEGITFQWYPTGLVHNKALNGNYLINVNKYKIPSEKVKGFDKKAKMIYEFDAADIGSSFMYPAMARSFVEAGMQFAAMFAYDPSQIAWSNTEYQTHFVNLLYAPSKAVSLMIASKAFHYLPLKKSYGDFPYNNVFENFRVYYNENLSELNSSKEFIYSNSTSSLPINPDSLTLIAGIGNSPLIKYDGTGAYFFEKLKNGIWKLEVYPDVLWLKDPFEQTSMKKQIAKLFWNKRKFEVTIPDLTDNFLIHSTSENMKPFYANGRSFSIKPGMYLLTAPSVKTSEIKKYLTTEKFLEGLYIPKSNQLVYVVNKTPLYVNVDNFKNFKFQIASEKEIKEATLHIKRLGWRRFEKHLLKNNGGFDYIIADSTKIIKEGELEFCISVKLEDGKIITMPDGKETSPDNWDFHYGKLWKTKVIDINTPIELFNASRDYRDIIFPQFTQSTRYFVDYRTGSTSENSVLSINVNTAGKDTIPFGFQLNIGELIKSLKDNLSNKKELIIKARSLSDSVITIGINLITDDGKCYQSKVQLNNQLKEKTIDLTGFKSGECLILPNSYPRFLPKIWNAPYSTNEKLDITKLEFVQFTIDIRNKSNISFEIENLIIK